MKFQALKPWVMGNESVTPRNISEEQDISLENGAFIALDVSAELFMANAIDTGNLSDSWNENQNYIERACEIGVSGPECGYSLDEEDKVLILEELGKPPECSYNIYFITIYNDQEEKIVYIGKTDAKGNRFANGHHASLALHNPKYKKFDKRVYFGTITFLSRDLAYIPLEFICPLETAKIYLSEMEALLIDHFNPELNKNKGGCEKLHDLRVHIQNFSEFSSFLKDYHL